MMQKVRPVIIYWREEKIPIQYKWDREVMKKEFYNNMTPFVAFIHSYLDDYRLERSH